MISNRFGKRMCLIVVAASFAGFVPCSAPGQDKAKPPLQIIAHGSLIPGVDPKDAEGATQPVCNLVQRRVKYPIKISVNQDDSANDLIDLSARLARTEKDLFELGARLVDRNDTTAHLAGVWGMEYGWLKEKYKELEPLALISHGGEDVQFHCIVIVRDRAVSDLKDLKGKRLATYDSASLMVHAALDEMLRKDGLPRKGFLQPGKKPEASVNAAVFAVKNRLADCAVITERDFQRMEGLYPKIGDHVFTCKQKSRAFPMAVLIGSRKKIEALQTDLWDALSNEFPTVHETSEGEQCISFWRFTKFEKPTKEYEQQVVKIAKELPISRLKEQD